MYARVSLAHKDMEPELECFDAQTRKSEGFGELKGGFVVRCSLKMCRECVQRCAKCLTLLNLSSLVFWIQNISSFLFLGDDFHLKALLD